MVEYIKRQDAIDAVEHITSSMSVCVNSYEQHGMKRMQRQAVIELANMPSAQSERIIYANMSDEEFEKWLYEHGICNPYIHDSIPCSAVPLLIDNAISELSSVQPDLVTWLLDTVWDEEMWELNWQAFPELLCRKLEKLGYVKRKGDEYERLDQQTGSD